MKVLLNKILILFYVSYLNSKRKKKQIKEVIGGHSKMLLVFFRSLGDAVIALDVLRTIDEQWGEKNEITLLSFKGVESFLKKYGNLKNINFISVNMDALNPKFAEIKKIVCKLYFNEFDEIVCFQQHSISQSFLVALNYGKCICLTDNSNLCRNKDQSFFGKHIYTDFVTCDYKDMFFSRYKRLIQYMGNNEYKSKIARIEIPYNEKRNKYIVLAIGAQQQERYLPEHVIETVISTVLKYSIYDIFITGSKADRKYANQLLETIPVLKSIRCVDYVGKTNLDEYMGLLRGAEFVVASDSGTTHIAVSLGKKVVCVSGFWDGNQFLPYEVDDDNGCFQPICIQMINMPECGYCRPNSIHPRKANRECGALIEQGKQYYCMNNISKHAIVDCIRKMLEIC